jgi:two-component system, NarL family, response regulator DegU
MNLNILIADDHPIFVKGLREVIESVKGLKVIAVANNGENAVTSFHSNKSIDIVIMDIDMPKMNGLEAAAAILSVRENIPVIILTMHKDKALFLRALEIGIQGYLLKENAVIDVITAINKVAEGNTYLSPELSIHLFKRNKIDENQLETMNILTPSEKKILHLIAGYKSSKEIADELFISEKTVFNHRMNICKKLNLTGKNSLLRFAIENIH